ncbi:MAG: hypothetical protein VB111_11675 [Clostridiaceae bacterium]|nr:hypothetical protein [Clostridiaceae bacterium]
MSGLLGSTQTAVEEMAAKISADTIALAELSEKWGKSAERQKELKDIYMALTSSVSMRIDRFLKDFGALNPGLI